MNMWRLKYKPLYRITVSLITFFRAIISYYLIVSLRRSRLISKQTFKRLLKRANRKNANNILKRVLKLEGLFIKLGQFISTRFDILPREYTEVLSTLQDEVPPRGFEEIKGVIEKEFNQPINKVFLEFNQKPIASASLAQVHKAVLHNGRTVAVKVQYPEIDEIVKIDLKALKIILSFLSFLQRPVNYRPVYEELEKYLSWELDFLNEGKNAEKIRKNFSGDQNVVVPEVIWNYTTKKVLTLEYIEGFKITDVEGVRTCGFTPEEVMNCLVDIYFAQILNHGFFQADPHPGNIFVMKDKKVCLLDFGLSKKISPRIIIGLTSVVQAIALKDVENAHKAFSEMGFSTLDKNPESLKNFAEMVVHYGRKLVTKNPKKINYQKLVQQIIDMGRSNPLVRVPTDFILLGRVFGHLMGIGRFYRVKVNFDKILSRYISFK